MAVQALSQAALPLLLLLSSLTFSDAATLSKRAIPAGWAYQGCFVDNVNGRILANTQPASQTNTHESCIAACIRAGFKGAGMEYGTECYCGNSIVNGGKLAAADTECSMNCAGNAQQKCGAGNRMSIFSTGGPLPIADPPPPAPVSKAQTTGLPGSWTYQGCLTEGTNGRTFPNQLILDSTNSATNCLSQCSKYGYGAGGMEYGRECYCGDVTDIAAAGATIRPESECATTCSGDPNYVCGGGNRLSYYTWTGASLTNWAKPTGNAAGRYQYLIGGVVIPLMAQHGVNGKVTFVEKFGTGPPNSTGSYELDVTQVNNLARAWRTLHVKTDVFCSAGLILPDKAGRQINVGGWSGDSTFGIRLYWPDGSPGVPGVRDWQENKNEVALQDGRWYPSAMIMSNGSILVIGGEDGSNGQPVPTLEILPRPAGGRTALTQDWLLRTDPYNLYPFLAVMPSGGIFVQYYNEARILDPVTFATIKLLPNVPGSVIYPTTSGRTYPFQGTAVLFPQRPPYASADFTVLICGGSNPGPAIALDNCVTIKPDTANPQWEIERMPSRRVMPCISALPDGTYLILNGAKQGTAGFGLATQPNLNAVLYDPSKPVNSRYSILANTIVPRLYHSESLLLQDGSVLVSGSDPQDGVNPQEYRIESFLPPYMTSGAARPSFTIANKNWSYGQGVPITITAGNAANIRVSLLGAESSTHGNSMGQRTIFPAVSCAGNTCTITAPPNSRVCPPGWFQLFVLDGPTPSVSTWVRIGGDPARLGNWPNTPTFSLPGI